MFKNIEFDNKTIKKYTAIFGTLFNEIVISRRTDNGTIEKRFKVPIDYAPYQKFLVKVKQDPDLDRPAAIVMPRMAYEITNIEYNSDLKIGNHGFRNDGSGSSRYTPVPYAISFNLYVLAKYTEDGNQIVERIIPFFRPDWTSTVQFFPDDPEYLIDVPLVLNSVTTEDGYEGDFEERRINMWTLSFTMHAKFFGPRYERKLIKFVKVDTYATDQATANLEDRDPDMVITVQPGLDANGNPTRDINNTIPYQDINPEDDWDYIVRIIDQ